MTSEPSSKPLPQVFSVSCSAVHGFSKHLVDAIELEAGLGVRGDAHRGMTVQHRSRVAQDPSQPNLRQVHLLHHELFEELAGRGLALAPAQMGENICTAGLDLLALPTDTELQIGAEVRLRVTGLRNPCAQIENFMPGLLAAVLDRGPEGQLIRKAGIMAVVLQGGWVRPGDAIQVQLPPLPHRALERV
ncbi:MOSC domain-containing protein [Paucibacter sp. DJ1R-11]|uniref:MOSC domain-containing protein n=1 Tax=Paucibacter sp. DJ1R-11 TaxID=2893556 RepID=UPI0021E405BD|nr:MOSC domain-containing protein [Paucibacter sp. DJ1R-11]MCV2364911.1 MOSC domain-containing protein [Paucibacter sp. DJ1R-11]